jgi:hypothetical protein
MTRDPRDTNKIKHLVKDNLRLRKEIIILRHIIEKYSISQQQMEPLSSQAFDVITPQELPPIIVKSKNGDMHESVQNAIDKVFSEDEYYNSRYYTE